MIGAARTLFVFATVAGLSFAGCTSGTTADCSPDAGGTPNSSAWCGVPAGDASVMPESSPTETGPGDSGGMMDAAPETGPDAPPEAAPDGGGAETGSAEAAADAPAG